jgi:hypothetical protein
MGCIFSVEMKSKMHVRTISISDDSHAGVLFEGDLGQLQCVSTIEGRSLELMGENGVLRLEVSEDVLRKVLTSSKREFCLSSNMEQKKVESGEM